MTEDEKFMRLAIEEAQVAAQEGEIPIGSVVVCHGKVIARGHNRTEALNDPTAHAEMLAITAATDVIGGKYLRGCTMYVTIEPCSMCAGAIGWSQLPRLVIGATEPKYGFSRYAPKVLHPRCHVTTGILALECSQLMVDFFQCKRNHRF